MTLQERIEKLIEVASSANGGLLYLDGDQEMLLEGFREQFNPAFMLKLLRSYGELAEALRFYEREEVQFVKKSSGPVEFLNKTYSFPARAALSRAEKILGEE